METAVIKKTLVLAACGEIATGLALLVVPSIVGRLLLGADLSGIAISLARILGISLVSLGIACWPGTPRIGMLTYSAGVTLYLAYLGFVQGFTGILLWPAVVLHAVLTLLLARSCRAKGKVHKEPPQSP